MNDNDKILKALEIIDKLLDDGHIKLEKEIADSRYHPNSITVESVLEGLKFILEDAKPEKEMNDEEIEKLVGEEFGMDEETHQRITGKIREVLRLIPKEESKESVRGPYDFANNVLREIIKPENQRIREKITEVLRLIDKDDPVNAGRPELSTPRPHRFSRTVDEYVYRVCTGILMEDS